MSYVGSIDQGTTSSRFIIFDKAGCIQSVSQKEHAQIMPSEGRVEHDPLEIWANVEGCIKNALQKAKLTQADLAAVGITNQRETTVVWSKSTGLPFCNAIVWMDMRSADICNALKEGHNLGQDRFREATGLPVVPYFAGTKLKWILDNIPGVQSAAVAGDALFGTIDTWLLWKLSKGKTFVTDVTNASRTLLMNLKSMNWDPEICAELQIPQQILPKIASSSEEYFTAEADCLKGVKVSGVLGDQQAALFGQTCFDSGEAKNTYGTGCFLLMNTGLTPVQSKHGLLTTVAYQLGKDAAPVFALEGSVAIGGALVQWLRDNLGLIQSADEVEALASQVEDNGGIYFVPAFSGLYAPYWRDDARGGIFGMTRFVTKAHIARAVLEATAFQSRDVFRAMQEDSKVTLTNLKVDGGMVVNRLLLQFQADLLDVPVIKPCVAETTALGAAYAAGLAVGFWKFEDLKKNWRVDEEIVPKMGKERRETLLKGWAKAIDRTFAWED